VSLLLCAAGAAAAGFLQKKDAIDACDILQEGLEKLAPKKTKDMSSRLEKEEGCLHPAARTRQDDCFSRFTYCIHIKKMLIAVAVLSTMIAGADALGRSGHQYR